MLDSKYLIILGIIFSSITINSVRPITNFTVKTAADNSVELEIHQNKTFDLQFNGILNEILAITWSDLKGIVTLDPTAIIINNTEDVYVNQDFPVQVVGMAPGRVDVQIITNITTTENFFIRFAVANSNALIIVSSIIGWLYFVAWSVSFYPQTILNYTRKSVVGLNLDFTILNFVGHSLYLIYNASMYWSTYIEEEYLKRYPFGLNPVKLNDVFFSIHATILTIVTLAQCFYYERGNQRISLTTRIVIGLFGVSLLVTFFLVNASPHILHWIDFLNVCSMIKLIITLIKYVPQAYSNYQRKSTDGWSISNILLDFSGGVLSLLQMFIIGYNYDDFMALFGDLTKFGLGIFSIAFDIIFMIQHYYLYRTPPYIEIPGDNVEDAENC